MTKEEWLEIGYDKKIIEDISEEQCKPFIDTYKMWFLSKMHKIKPQSLDRIEVTFNKYYRDNDICNKLVHTINEDYIIDFLNSIVVNNSISEKEYKRIYQIINNVMVYSYDMNIGYAMLLNWNKVRKCVYTNEIEVSYNREYIIPHSDICTLYEKVIYENIYPLKRSCCLAILLNFYLGLRIGELSALKFTDFDLDNKIVQVVHNQVKFYRRDDNGQRLDCMHYEVVDSLKTKYSSRVIPLVDECIGIYNEIVSYHNSRNYNSPYICYDGTDTILERSVARTLTRLCKLCGISHINSHRIRKTYASELHNRGIPTRVISDLLGHSDISTTEGIYLLGYEDIEIYRPRIEKALKKGRIALSGNKKNRP